MGETQGSRFMKKLGIVVGILVAVLIVGIAAAWLFFDVNHYRGLIQTQLEQQLGRKATLGTMRLGLFPLRFQVAEPVIAEDPRFGSTPFLRAENLAIQVSLSSLIRGAVKVQSIELRRPSVELVKNKEGVWNFSTLSPASGSAPSSSAGGAPSSSGGAAREFALEKLTITDGQVGITDLQQGKSRSVYDHIDLTLADYTAGQPFSFDLAAHIQGEGKQEVRLKGQGGPLSQSNPGETPFHATLSLNQVGLEGLKKFLDTEVLTKSSGFFSGEGQLDNKNGS